MFPLDYIVLLITFQPDSFQYWIATLTSNYYGFLFTVACLRVLLILYHFQASAKSVLEFSVLMVCLLLYQTGLYKGMSQLLQLVSAISGAFYVLRIASTHMRYKNKIAEVTPSEEKETDEEEKEDAMEQFRSSDLEDHDDDSDVVLSELEIDDVSASTDTKYENNKETEFTGISWIATLESNMSCLECNTRAGVKGTRLVVCNQCQRSVCLRCIGRIQGTLIWSCVSCLQKENGQRCVLLPLS